MELYSDNKLNRLIGEYYNGTQKVIAVTELINVFLESVEASFQKIIDACKFALSALYQLVKNLVFCLKPRLNIFISTYWFKIAISSPNGLIYYEP